MDKLFKAAITEAADKKMPRMERKTKWMTEDTLNLVEKRRQVQNNQEKYETLPKEIRKKCDDAKEKWIKDKCRNIQPDRRSTEQPMYKNINIRKDNMLRHNMS